MARLLYKLTEMSVNHANMFVLNKNQLSRDIEEAQQSQQFHQSLINDEFPVKQQIKFVLSDEEMMKFENNTQLLTDESISVPALVQQLQILAKKHVDSLNLMAEEAKTSIQLRYRAIKIEQEFNRSIKSIRAANKENAELLLNELVKQYNQPQQLNRYLQNLLPQLQDIDQETRKRIFNKAMKITTRENSTSRS